MNEFIFDTSEFQKYFVLDVKAISKINVQYLITFTTNYIKNEGWEEISKHFLKKRNPDKYETLHPE